MSLGSLWDTFWWIFDKVKEVGGIIWDVLWNYCFDFPDALYLFAPWVIWYLILTQPKRVDWFWTEVVGKLGEFMKYIYWPPIPGWAKLIYFVCMGWVPAAVAFIISRTKLFRFIFTLSVMNLAVSPHVGNFIVKHFDKYVDVKWTITIPVFDKILDAATALNYTLAWVCIPVFIIWAFFRGEEYKEHMRKVYQKKGYFLGTIILLVEDFFPKFCDIDSIKCKGKTKKGRKCGKKIKKEQEFCPFCLTPNPEADYKCSKCGQVCPADTVGCSKCGTPRSASGKKPPSGGSPASTPKVPATPGETAPKKAADPVVAPPSPFGFPAGMQGLLPMLMGAVIVCPYCKGENMYTAVVCTDCGKPIRKQPAAAQTSANKGFLPRE